MRSVHLIVALAAIRASGAPIEPRDFDFGFTSGIDSSAFTDENIGDLSFSTGGSIDGGGFDVANNQFTDPGNLAGVDFGSADLTFGSAEGLDLATLPADTPIDTSVFTSEPAPQIVADVPDPGLGAVDGSLIAVAPTTPDTNQITPQSGVTIGFVDPGPIPEFTAANLNTAAIDAVENPTFTPADVASVGNVAANPGAFDFVTVPGFEWTDFQPSEEGLANLVALDEALKNPFLIGPPDTPVTPVTPPVAVVADNGAGLGISTKEAPADLFNPDSAGSVVVAGFTTETLPADTLKPNLDLLNTDFSTVKFSGADGVQLTGLGGDTPGTQVASTEGNLGTTPTLEQLRTDSGKLAADPTLPTEEHQYWTDVNKVLTAKDFGVATLPDDAFKVGSTETGGTPNANTPANTPANTQANTKAPLTPQAQAAVNAAVAKVQVPQQYRQPGFNAGQLAQQLLTTFGQAAIQVGSVIAARPAQNNNQILTVVQRVGVPVSVTNTIRIGVPVTVIETVGGKPVTRILVYRPKTGTETLTGTASAKTTVAVTPTGTTKTTGTPTPSPKVVGAGKPVGAGTPAGAGKPAGAVKPAGSKKRHVEEASEPDTAVDDYPVDWAFEHLDADATEQAETYGDRPAWQTALLASPEAAGNPNWNGILCPLGIFGYTYSTDWAAERADAEAKGCPQGVS